MELCVMGRATGIQTTLTTKVCSALCRYSTSHKELKQVGQNFPSLLCIELSIRMLASLWHKNGCISAVARGKEEGVCVCVQRHCEDSGDPER